MSIQSIHILFYHIDAFLKKIEAQNSKVNVSISEPLKPLVVSMKKSTKMRKQLTILIFKKREDSNN